MPIFVCSRFGNCWARRISRHAAELRSVRQLAALLRLPMTHPIIISHIQTQPLLKEQEAVRYRAEVSPDLGLTTVEVPIAPGVGHRR
ncbi:MAG: hypothetical protein H8D43_00095 [Chloroflexi bacterium]|nr:hypothetical protein [Chloroflexota bacterium]